MKTQEPIITTDLLLEWKNEKEIEFAGSYGKGSHKSLRCTLNENYRVYENHELLKETTQPQVAIDLYKSLK